MKMKKCLGIIAGSIVFASTILAGCGSSDSYSTTEAPAASMKAAGSNAMETADYAVYEEEAAYDTAEAGEVAEETVKNSRKLITTINIEAETEDFDKARSQVENKVGELGGYIESSRVYNDSKSANYTIRIPASKADSFIELVEGNNNITSKSVDVEDITLSYADTESRKKALRTEEERLLKILESAETVEDLITVESRLSDVRYQIESIESQLRTYDNKVDYTTVFLYLEQVEKFTPVEKKGAFARMGEGFVDSLVAVKNFFVELFVLIVIHIPQLVIFAAFVTVIVLIVKKVDKKNKEKKAAAYAQYMQANQYAQPVQNAPAQNDSAEGKNEQ
ncbi:DUF4349 domain-containing protein [Butyrivibrio sp. MC2021]|uniref:DUF4349 domain-containing protein n=1 Tax=Butyrivibrio sp. MC2021 TaxID=1408306 RepID=UPI000685318D|nr:DUF4349 domain-containing protein [Butyrivibrio sp. MC2021]